MFKNWRQKIMGDIIYLLERKYPCRSEFITNLVEEISPNPGECLPRSIYLSGHAGTGKTAIVRDLIRLYKDRQIAYSVYIDCIECYSLKVLLEIIVVELSDRFNNSDPGVHCDNMKELIELLKKINITSKEKKYIIVLDNAERLRDMDQNVFSSFLRIQEYTGLNICLILISQLPIEKYYSKSGLHEMITLHCSQYTKHEIYEILSSQFEIAFDIIKQSKQNNFIDKLLMDIITQDFYNNYLNIFLGVFYKVCRDLRELRITANSCFIDYVSPVLNGSIDKDDVSRLWKNITITFRIALAQLYIRMGKSSGDVQSFETVDYVSNESAYRNEQKIVKTLELPYYAKYLLIASFIASYNSPKEDKRLFVKNHGAQRKRTQTLNSNAKVVEKMNTSLGPKSFTIDRLLAIFYAIIEDKIGLTCNLLSQVSTLVQLKLLSFVNGENNVMEGSARLQCTVGLEFIKHIGKMVDFNVCQFLCDFNS